VKNKDIYDLTDLHFIIIYPSYWQEYAIEIESKKTGEKLDTIKTRKSEINAIMEWLESEKTDV